MEADFWHDRWATNRIGFHEQSPNSLLVDYFDVLSLKQNSRIFVPLCGKTSAISWLLSQGHSVVGAELNEQAVEQLFLDLETEPRVTTFEKVKQYEAKNLTVFVGDIFQLTHTQLGKVDAVFDRAALVALPEEMRNCYTKHLIYLTGVAPQLLIAFEYDQSLREGPPFSIPEREIFGQYQNNFSITQLENKEFLRTLQGIKVREVAWHLATKHD